MKKKKSRGGVDGTKNLRQVSVAEHHRVQGAAGRVSVSVKEEGNRRRGGTTGRGGDLGGGLKGKGMPSK